MQNSNHSLDPSASIITPPGLSFQEWTAREVAATENGDNNNNPPLLRMEMSRAVNGILRDNIPSSLAYDAQDLTLISCAIEEKLYKSAPSAQAYSDKSTLEFRMKALATAVLIHSDTENRYDNHNGISDTCSRLLSSARNSLVYSVMVLVSYEKQNLEKNRTSGGGFQPHLSSHHHQNEVLPHNNTNISRMLGDDHKEQNSTKKMGAAFGINPSIAVDQSEQKQTTPPAA